MIMWRNKRMRRTRELCCTLSKIPLILRYPIIFSNTKKGKKWFHGNQKDERVFRNGGKCVFIFYFIFSLQFMLLTFIHLFFLVKNDDHFSFWDDFDLMFTLYRKKLSHNLLNLKQILLILAAVTQDYNIRKSGFSLKLDLLPSYSFE